MNSPDVGPFAGALFRSAATSYDARTDHGGEDVIRLESISLRTRLLALLVAGAGILVASKLVPPAYDWGLLHDLGIAVVIAGLLGLTVDFSLKTEVARDAFKATLGYILRPEFRNEVARITSYKFLCESHVMVLQVNLLEDHVVEVAAN